MKFGLENVHIAILNGSEYETPVKLEGAVSLTANPSSDETDLRADNRGYYRINKNNGYDGELEISTLQFLILESLLSYTQNDFEIEHWGVFGLARVTQIMQEQYLTTKKDDKMKEFALLGQIRGDDKNRRFVFYKCIPQRLDQEASTIEGSIDPKTDSLEFKVEPIELNGKIVVKGVMGENANNYSNFFNEVIKPN